MQFFTKNLAPTYPNKMEWLKKNIAYYLNDHFPTNPCILTKFLLAYALVAAPFLIHHLPFSILQDNHLLKNSLIIDFSIIITWRYLVVLVSIFLNHITRTNFSLKHLNAFSLDIHWSIKVTYISTWAVPNFSPLDMSSLMNPPSLIPRWLRTHLHSSDFSIYKFYILHPFLTCTY